MRRTISLRAIAREVRAEPPDDGAAELQLARPRRRADCAGGPRPCPWVSCRWHLFLDVTPAGGIQFNHGPLPLEQLEETCALDVADGPGVTLERIGELMAVTRERVRQIEERALVKLTRRGRRAGLEVFEETPWS